MLTAVSTELPRLRGAVLPEMDAEDMLGFRCNLLPSSPEIRSFLESDNKGTTIV